MRYRVVRSFASTSPAPLAPCSSSSAEYETQTEAEVAYEHACRIPGTYRVYLDVQRLGVCGSRWELLSTFLVTAAPRNA